MGKLRAFQILFDNDREVYNSGDVISGQVLVDLEEAKQLRGIYMHFQGRAVVRWSEIESRGKSKVTIYFHSGEQYFDTIITIFGKDRTASEDLQYTLDAGIHRFPFQFQLPNRPMPCSFEGTLGYVRFFMRAVIDRPWKFDHVTKRAFTVAGIPYDLNKISNPMTPVSAEDEKTVCCLCCATGPISVSASTDKRVYLPGETVYISATMENRSNRSVHSLEAELIQMVSYAARRDGHGSPGYRTTSHVVTSVKSEGCGPYDQISWIGKPMIIPPLPACCLEGCTFIDIRYYVKFTADVAQTPFDVDIMLEIVVGTIPLEGHYSLPDYGAATAGMAPPPTYEAALDGVKEIRDEHDNEYTFGHLVYTPLYMIFKPPGSNENSSKRSSFRNKTTSV
ncbi:arrestin domain-containing protein 3-like isoform X2 [Amphiura filiformis]|uniref:arrestin domain-containing protein 3-like isoform X2 n=1 Tax=Amphiura filiformis TaxID=82378 RepID=UPI003B2128FD